MFHLNLDDNNLKVLAAVAGAAGAIVSAIITGIIGYFVKARADAQIESIKAKQSEMLESIKNQLAIEYKLKDARIDYEYNARKRIYEEVEPLLFAANISCLALHKRLKNMNDRLRDGFICRDQNETWMRDDYYVKSTAYRLLVPIVYCRLLSQRLSQLDLSLEPTIGREYVILRIFGDIFCDHFDLAVDPKLGYRPYAKVSQTEREKDPAQYNYQGLVRGQVERLVAGMIIDQPSGASPIEWFRFDQQLQDIANDLTEAYEPLGNLLTGFYPETHSITWRVLISFNILSGYFAAGKEFSIEEYGRFADRLGPKVFDFRTTTDVQTIDDPTVLNHFLAARNYLHRRISNELTEYEALVKTRAN